MLNKSHDTEISDVEHNLKLLKMRLYVLSANHESKELNNCIEKIKYANRELHTILSQIRSQPKEETKTNG